MKFIKLTGPITALTFYLNTDKIVTITESKMSGGFICSYINIGEKNLLSVRESATEIMEQING